MNEEAPATSPSQASETRGAVPKPRVFYWPDTARTNPYLDLLYRRAQTRYDIALGDIDTAVAALPSAPAGVVFHLHWLRKLFIHAPDAAAAHALFENFLTRLHHFKSSGGRIVWTIHNSLTHDSPFPAVEAEMSARIAALADVIHLHSAASVAEVETVFPLPRDRIAISRHGHYRDAYPACDLTRTEARLQLGLSADDDVLLFFGLIRPYKGVDRLIAAFRTLLPTRPTLRLLIVGRQMTDPMTALDRPLSPAETARISVVDRFVADAEIALWFRAADMTVLPYRSILTSGALMLSLSFGVPVITSRAGMVEDVLEGQDAGISLPHNADGPALVQAIHTVLARKEAGTLRDMARHAATRATTLDWPDFAPVLHAALSATKGAAEPSQVVP